MMRLSSPQTGRSADLLTVRLHPVPHTGGDEAGLEETHSTRLETRLLLQLTGPPALLSEPLRPPGPGSELLSGVQVLLSSLL